MKLFSVLAAVSLISLPSAAMAERMGYDVPTRSSSALPTRPVEAPPAPAPTVAPPPPAPAPVAPPAVTHRPVRQPDGYVHHADYRSFPQGHIMGYPVWAEDNGYSGTDRIVVNGPDGQEHIVANCNITRDWNSWGSNSQQFVHEVVSRWCSW